ncbi:MAG TPA: methyltransferase domain-containing protein [Xanthobacteraceae bacterium]|jgi:SAM-dependent methyltransferase
MGKAYDQRFFDWVNFTAARSARHVISILITHIRPSNVLDVGCGQGAWLAVWRDAGVVDLMGVDGGYVAQDVLLIPREQFLARDLAQPFCLDRRFDLVQSLEVAEHLPPEASAGFVHSLCAHGDVVVFSAAQPGQGGEGHVNERNASAWAREFSRHGYTAFDFVRPQIKSNRSVEPWYRYNTIVFANSRGAHRLSAFARSSRVDDIASLDGAGNVAWKIRRALLRPWPPRMLTLLSRLRYRLAMARANASTSRSRIPARQAGRGILNHP